MNQVKTKIQSLKQIIKDLESLKSNPEAENHLPTAQNNNWPVPRNRPPINWIREKITNYVSRTPNQSPSLNSRIQSR